MRKGQSGLFASINLSQNSNPRHRNHTCSFPSVRIDVVELRSWATPINTTRSLAAHRERYWCSDVVLALASLKLDDRHQLPPGECHELMRLPRWFQQRAQLAAPELDHEHWLQWCARSVSTGGALALSGGTTEASDVCGEPVSASNERTRVDARPSAKSWQPEFELSASEVCSWFDERLVRAAGRTHRT